VSHLEIGAVRVVSCGASVDEKGQFNVGVSQLDVELKQLQWRYTQGSFPHAADEGMATANTTASFNVTIDMAAGRHNVLKLRLGQIGLHLGAKHHSWLSAAIDKLTNFMVPLVSEAVHLAAKAALDESTALIHKEGACAFVNDALASGDLVKLRFTSYEPIETHIPVVGDVNISVNSTAVTPPTSMRCEQLAFNGTVLSARIEDVSFGASFVWGYQKLHSTFWHNEGTGSANIVAGASLHIDLMKPSGTSMKVKLPTLQLKLHADADDWMYGALSSVMSPLVRESAQLLGGHLLAHFIARCIADPSCPKLKQGSEQLVIKRPAGNVVFV